MILAQGSTAIGVEHLPSDLRRGAGGGDRRHVQQTLADLNRQHIERTLRAHGGNRTRAAAALMIERTSLLRLIRELGITELPDGHRGRPPSPRKRS